MSFTKFTIFSMHHNKDLNQRLLNDKGIKIILKKMIRQKADRYDELSKKWANCTEQDMETLLAGNVSYSDLKTLLEYREERKEVMRIERDLACMCYGLKQAEGNPIKRTPWEDQYEFATQYAQIENVVQVLTGHINFRRNIKCPFHTDKTPSLKVYSKSNRFVCFGCNARGSPIDFVMKYKNCTFRDAVLLITQI